MTFCDTSYLVRLYLEDEGWEDVRSLCASDDVAAAEHARAEIPAALHRARRERRLATGPFREVMDQFECDCAEGAFFWQPLTREVLDSVAAAFRDLPADCFLRAADALHLACAREHGFEDVYSNDRNFLKAAEYFGLRGINVIGGA